MRLPLYQRLLSYLLIIYLLYAALLGLLVPHLIEDQAPSRIEHLLGRTVELDDVSINPFTLKVKLTNLRILEPDRRPFTGFDQLQVQFSLWQSVVNTKIAFSDLRLTKPFANLVRIDENKFNFSDITEKISAINSSTTASEPSSNSSKHQPLPQISVKNFIVQAASFSFNDQLTGAVVSYPDINLALTNFDTMAMIEETSKSLVNQYQIEFTGLDTSRLSTQGVFQLTPLQLSGKLQLDNVQLAAFWPFASQRITADLDQGTLNFGSDYELASTGKGLQFLTQHGRLSLHDLLFSHREKPLISLPEFQVDEIAIDLQKQQVDIADISSKGLKVQASIDDNGLDLVQFFTPSSTPTIIKQSDFTDTSHPSDKPTYPTEDTESDLNWIINLNQFSLKNADLNLNESLVTDATTWRIHLLNLSTGAISSKLTETVNYKLDLAINQQGAFSSTGKIDLKQQSLDAELSLSDLRLTQFQPYLAPYVNFSLEQGAFNTQGKIYADVQGQATYTGDINLSDMLIKDKKFQKPLLRWEDIKIGQLQFDNKGQSLRIGHIALTQPYAQFIIAADKTTNTSNLVFSPRQNTVPLSSEKISQTTTSVSLSKDKMAKTPLQLVIDKITLNGGAADFIDNSLQPGFATSVEELKGNIGKLSTTSEQNATVDINGMINHYAPISLTGEINPLRKDPFIDVELAVQHFELPSVSPYSGAYTGYDIANGKLSLALKYKLENNYLKGINQLTLKQLDMDRSKDNENASLLPISLAIPLLKDRNGMIDLNINVSGDMNNPNFNVAGIIVKSITDIVMKAATSPLSLLASLAGSDEDLNAVNFTAGSSQLTKNGLKKMATLGTVLNDRPTLKLSIEGAYHGQYDEQAIADAMLNEKLAKLTGAEVDTNLNSVALPQSGPIIDALIQIYEQDVKRDATQLKIQIATQYKLKSTDIELQNRWHKALYQQASAAQDVKLEELRMLAKTRAQAVKTNLVKEQQVKTERILLISSKEHAQTYSTQAFITLVTQQ